MKCVNGHMSYVHMKAPIADHLEIKIHVSVVLMGVDHVFMLWVRFQFWGLSVHSCFPSVCEFSQGSPASSHRPQTCKLGSFGSSNLSIGVRASIRV